MSDPLETVVELARSGDVEWGRFVLGYVAHRVESGQEIPDSLMEYVAFRLNQALGGPNEKFAANMGVSTGSGERSVPHFRPVGRDLALAVLVMERMQTMTKIRAFDEVSRLTFQSQSTVSRAYLRFKEEIVIAELDPFFIKEMERTARIVGRS